MRHWLGMGAEEWREWVAEQGQPAFRAGQIADWLHAKRVTSPSAMGNVPAALRSALADKGSLRTLSELQRRDAPDGLTSKWLFRSDLGQTSPARFESVLIIEKQLSRRTVCVSCMAGCPLDCGFCATGRHGFVRNLAAGEIIEQAYHMDEFARGLGDRMGVSHVVFMGMGEPLLNLDAVLTAAERFANPVGLGISGRHITLSTAGIPDGIRELARRKVTYRLALSLHAPNQAVRERIMPAARRWPLPELFAALDDFAAVASRALTFEYCLIGGVNASLRDAKELASRIRRYQGKVNLIPMNPVPGCDFQPPPARDIRAFQMALEDAGIPATVRMEKGQEIGAACGQLQASQEE